MTKYKVEKYLEKLTNGTSFWFHVGIASDESEEDNTYISYNKVIGTSLDEKLYLAFEVLDYALLSAPGAPLKRALTDAGKRHYGIV